MSNQEIFNWLSVLECELFYKRDSIPGAEQAHDLVRDALNIWHSATGCTNP